MNITLAVSKLKEIDDLDHHGRYGRLAREAIEALEPDHPAWDAGWNRNYEPVETRAAEIYATFNYAGPGKKPAWVRGGNSNRQDDARHDARRELRAAGHTPSLSRPPSNSEAK